ncbi:hypothetical protein BaRGS_00008004 [Batillaria attramentaria]|uniref:Uncharacterized protein n=1 Tax=Batillaria attramentaria TaxID=370345 RepID=A0ABD0LNK8_9CAEN
MRATNTRLHTCQAQHAHNQKLTTKEPSLKHTRPHYKIPFRTQQMEAKRDTLPNQRQGTSVRYATETINNQRRQQLRDSGAGECPTNLRLEHSAAAGEIGTGVLDVPPTGNILLVVASPSGRHALNLRANLPSV